MEPRTDRILDACFDAARSEDYRGSADEMASWLAAAGARTRIRPQATNSGLRRRIARVLDHVAGPGSRGRFVPAGVAALVLVVAGMMPVSRETTIGSIYSWTIDRAPSYAMGFVDAHPWIDRAHLSVSTHGEGSETRLILALPAAAADSLHDRIEALQALDGVGGFMHVPVRERVRRPAYVIVLQAVGLGDGEPIPDDAEVARRMREQLEAGGLEGAAVLFERQSDGSRKLEITAPK